nr:MAG TPA: hypothetical protein [Bacteriophage sp.]DAS07701.1 MAG TPA: hypothetical protein [Caudoviricetes sp.]
MNILNSEQQKSQLVNGADTQENLKEIESCSLFVTMILVSGNELVSPGYVESLRIILKKSEGRFIATCSATHSPRHC